MNENPSNQLEKRTKRLGWKLPVFTALFITIRSVLFLFVAVAVCALVIWRIVLYREVNAQFARIQAAGLPTSGAELNSWRPTVPDEENGARVLTQAFSLLHTLPQSDLVQVADSRLIARTNVWAASIRDLVLTYVQTNQPALAKARESLVSVKFRYPVDFSYGLDAELPHLSGLKQIARIAALQSVIQAEEGHLDEWPESITTQLKLAATLNEEPSLISHLARNRIICTAAKATERNLNQSSLTAAQCALLQDAFSRAGETNLFPRALIGERAQFIPVFRMSWEEFKNVGQEDRPHKPQQYSGEPVFVLWLSGFFERDLNFYLETMDKSISLASLPSPQNLTLTNYYQSASETAQKRVYFFSNLLLPTLSHVVVREATTRAMTEMSATALAVERFRQEHGKLPASLEQLTPDYLKKLPVDPFDGAPLRYKILPRGYLLYSVDADGHDDLGREKSERKKSTDTTSYDLTFIVER